MLLTPTLAIVGVATEDDTELLFVTDTGAQVDVLELYLGYVL